MSVPDYTKQRAKILKWNSDCKVVENNRYKHVGVAVVQLEKAAKALRNDVALWKMSHQHLYVINREWVKVADKIILKQAELKNATKAKDQNKISTLKKEIEKLNKESTKIEASFTKAYDETVIIDKQFSVFLRATNELPK